MKEEDFLLTDWHRIFIGNAPATFLLEVLIRTIFLYIFLLIVLRLMGKRMGGMLTIAELAVMLTLGAIICVPMQIPDRGILHGFLVLICALTFQRLFSLFGIWGGKVEKITEGEEVILVKDGTIDTHALKDANISHQQLFAVLRSQGIYNLGAVERVYLEAAGLFSVFPFAEKRTGLPLFPDLEQAQLEEEKQHDNYYVCCHCGNLSHQQSSQCDKCSANLWTKAIQ